MIPRSVVGALLAVALTVPAYAHHHHREGHFPWCGLYARTLVARDPGPAFNRAAEWLRWGMPSGPRVGAMVVWNSPGHHHVGKIVGGPDALGRWVVLSGNTGSDRGVHAAPRSVVGARFRVASYWD
jgi:hypothetical protein